MIAALRLGPRQHAEIARNRTLTSSPTMPAIDRYTGVLFDAFDAASLSSAEREFAHEHLLVQSALLGPVAALDLIPAYRLSWDSRLSPTSLAATWARPVAAELRREPGLILDLRSEGYARLGAVPARDDVVYLRVVSGEGDRRRALNHFNKRSKGLFARALVRSGVVPASVSELMDWAASSGFDLAHRVAGELELVAPLAESVTG